MDPLDTLGVFVDGSEVLLEDDLLGRGGTDYPGEVAAVGVVLVGAADVVKAKPEKERLEAVLGALQIDEGVLAGAGEVADGLIVDSGNVDGGEVAGAQEPCELNGVATVGFDAVAGFLRDQGRGHDDALEALPAKVAVQDVAAGAGLVGEQEPRGFAVEPAQELVDVGLAGADGAEEGGFLA